MSNLSVLKRLETALAAYEREAMSHAAFIEFLNLSINELEAVPHSICREVWKHEYQIGMEVYYEEEGFESKLVAVKQELRTWIQQLKELYGTGS
jgi:hypothetical protein